MRMSIEGTGFQSFIRRHSGHVRRRGHYRKRLVSLKYVLYYQDPSPWSYDVSVADNRNAHAGSSNFCPCNTLNCLLTAVKLHEEKNALCEINIEEVEIEPGLHYA